MKSFKSHIKSTFKKIQLFFCEIITIKKSLILFSILINPPLPKPQLILLTYSSAVLVLKCINTAFLNKGGTTP